VYVVIFLRSVVSIAAQYSQTLHYKRTSTTQRERLRL